MAMADRRLWPIVLVAGLAAGCQGDAEDKDTFDFDVNSTGAVGETEAAATTGGEAGDSETGDSGDSGDVADEDSGEGGGDSHALGTIVLGENHPVGAPDTLTAIPSIYASFVPDVSATAVGCNQTIGGCDVILSPVCLEPCDVGLVCVFNELCEGECGLACDLPCAADEVCYYPIPGAPACKKVDTFDAGALTFEGTTVPITAFPPYNAVGGPTGAPFSPGAELSVTASGATGAGYDAFEGSFTATGPLVTYLDQIDTTDAYGVGHLPISWEAGEDEIRVAVTVTSALGTVGSFVCAGVDATGTYDIPRSALSAAANDEQLSTVAITVERRKITLMEGLGTHGTILDGTVQAEGWIELATASSESAIVLNCGGLQTWCTNVCADLQTDPLHCGECGMACDKLQLCTLGVCG